MRVDRCPVYVLHRRAWRDTSLIMELFCDQHGRVAAIARGARGGRSQWFGLGEPFRLLEASWSRRGEMATLTGLEPVQAPHRLSGRATWCGLYANELLLKLWQRDDPAGALFERYAELLPRLADPATQSGGLRAFELALLAALGVAPRLDRCAATGSPVRSQHRYRIEAGLGPVPAAGSGSAVSGRILLKLSAGQMLDRTESGTMMPILRELIDQQLEGRKLHTPALFRESWS